MLFPFLIWYTVLVKLPVGKQAAGISFGVRHLHLWDNLKRGTDVGKFVKMIMRQIL